jgi:hypothetical protein
MPDHAALRSAFERNARIVTTRPAVAQKTYVTRVHIRDGLTCDIEEGPWTLTADLGTIAGGNAAGLYGRNAGYPAPPVQSRTCSFPASGSSVVLASAVQSQAFRQTLSDVEPP